MKGCPRKKIFLALLDGELDVRREKKLKRHLERCDGCRRELDKARMDREWLNKTIGLLNEPEPGTIPPLVLTESKEPQPPRLSFWQHPVPVPVSVMLLLFAVFIFLIGSFFHQNRRLKSLQSSVTASASQATVVLTMPGMRQTVNLGIDPYRLQLISEPNIVIVKEEGNDKGI